MKVQFAKEVLQAAEQEHAARKVTFERLAAQLESNNAVQKEIDSKIRKLEVALTAGGRSTDSHSPAIKKLEKVLAVARGRTDNSTTPESSGPFPQVPQTRPGEHNRPGEQNRPSEQNRPTSAFTSASKPDSNPEPPKEKQTSKFLNIGRPKLPEKKNDDTDHLRDGYAKAYIKEKKPFFPVPGVNNSRSSDNSRGSVLPSGHDHPSAPPLTDPPLNFFDEVVGTGRMHRAESGVSEEGSFDGMPPVEDLTTDIPKQSLESILGVPQNVGKQSNIPPPSPASVILRQSAIGDEERARNAAVERSRAEAADARAVARAARERREALAASSKGSSGSLNNEVPMPERHTSPSVSESDSPTQQPIPPAFDGFADFATFGESGDDAAVQKAFVKRLQLCLKRPENLVCADCTMRLPRWASVNLGIFVCTNCSGIHRSLGVHISFVRSTQLDRWDEESVTKLESMGNSRANAYWEANLPLFSSDVKPTTCALPVVQKYIQRKYQAKEFVDRNAAGPITGHGPFAPPAPSPPPPVPPIPPPLERDNLPTSPTSPVASPTGNGPVSTNTAYENARSAMRCECEKLLPKTHVPRDGLTAHQKKLGPPPGDFCRPRFCSPECVASSCAGFIKACGGSALGDMNLTDVTVIQKALKKMAIRNHPDRHSVARVGEAKAATATVITQQVSFLQSMLSDFEYLPVRVVVWGELSDTKSQKSETVVLPRVHVGASLLQLVEFVLEERPELGAVREKLGCAFSKTPGGNETTLTVGPTTLRDLGVTKDSVFQMWVQTEAEKSWEAGFL